MTNVWRGMALASLIAAASGPARAETEWDACAAAPTRACVLDLAARDVATIEGRIDRASALADLALARSKAGFASEADQDFAKAAHELQKDDAPMPGYGPRVLALTHLATALAQADRIDEAIRTIDEVKINDGGAARAMTAIATAEAKAGRTKEAAQTCAKALELAQVIEFQYGRVSLLRDVSDAERAAGLVADADRTFAQARDIAVAHPKYSGRDLDLGAIARQEAKAGNIATALQTAALVEETFQRNFAVLDVLRAALAAGKFDEAKPIAPTLSGNARVTAFDELASSLAKAGRKAEADEALASARQFVVALPDGPEKASGYLGVAGVETELGAAAAGAADVASARAIADGLAANAKGNATQAVISALAKAGRTQEAFALAAAMSPDLSRSAAYLSLTQIQMASGDFSGALRAAREVTNRIVRLNMLERLAGAMPK